MMLFRKRKIKFDTPKVMGILNATPDSFSDGGQFNSVQAALVQAQGFYDAGAMFIDVGGESTRPGASEVSIDEELSRVIPIIEAINSNIDVVISIDTSKPQVMQEAVNAGASLINDVRALRLPGALETAAKLAQTHNVPSCIMHMKGNPKDMQDDPLYLNIVQEVTQFFELRIAQCVAAGFSYNQLMIDPGFGFGKTLDNNYQLLKHLASFAQFDMPLLSGTSRKSMIGNLLDKPTEQRLAGSITTATLAANAGASIIRAHDVEETMDVVKIVGKLQAVD